MLQELEVYIPEQTKDGRLWASKDFETTLMILWYGTFYVQHLSTYTCTNLFDEYQDRNVPTNYKIKEFYCKTFPDDKEKNLGCWVNRQRSLFQAGKLKKDCQQDLEKNLLEMACSVY